MEEGTSASDNYGTPPPQAGYPIPPYQGGRYYPETNEFPPPPTVASEDYAMHPPMNGYPPNPPMNGYPPTPMPAYGAAPYDPSQYPPPPQQIPPPGRQSFDFGPPPQDPYTADARYRRGDDNVSAPFTSERSAPGGSRLWPLDPR